MTDYKKLIDALRETAKHLDGISRFPYDDDPAKRIYSKKMTDAADAIEALQAELEQCTLFNTDLLNMREMSKEEADEILEYIRNAPVGPLEPMQIELLPKQGEWVEENRRPRSSQFVCSVCHRTAYDPQPTRDKAWRKRCRYSYCPNCGARMDGGKDDI